MARVVWTTPAAAHIRIIAEYISQHDPSAARQVAGRLVQAGDSLAEFPNRGRVASKGERQLTIVWPYVITYRVVGESVFIKSVRHGRRRPV